MLFVANMVIKMLSFYLAWLLNTIYFKWHDILINSSTLRTLLRTLLEDIP